MKITLKFITLFFLAFSTGLNLPNHFFATFAKTNENP